MNTGALQSLPDKHKGKTINEIAVLLFDSSKINNTELATILGIGRTTLWRHRKNNFQKSIIAYAVIQVLGYIPPCISKQLSLFDKDPIQISGIITHVKWVKKRSVTVCRIKSDTSQKEIVISFPFDCTNLITTGNELIIPISSN